MIIEEVFAELRKDKFAGRATWINQRISMNTQGQIFSQVGCFDEGLWTPSPDDMAAQDWVTWDRAPYRPTGAISVRRALRDLEAMEFTGDNLAQIVAWAFDTGEEPSFWVDKDRYLRVPSLVGTDAANRGDWILRDELGQFVVVRKDQFNRVLKRAQTR